MEKLIELLNKYVEETDFWDDFNEYNEAEILDEETLEVNWKYHDIEYLYTKRFWFIKWLVGKDKIDFSIMRISAWYELYENFIMYLSIQDDPIKYLISYLK